MRAPTVVLLLCVAAVFAACRPAGPPPPPSAASVTCDSAVGDLRACVYAGPNGRVKLVDSLGMRMRLAVAYAGGWRPLPEFWGDTVWPTCGPVLAPGTDGAPAADHVQAVDLDADGRADVVAVGACYPVAGPDGQRPFPVGTVYWQRTEGRWVTDPARDSSVSANLPQRCALGPCDAVAAVRAALASPAAGGRP